MDLKLPGVRFVSCKNTSGSVYLQDTNNPWENTRTHTFHSDPNVHCNSNFLLPFSPPPPLPQQPKSGLDRLTVEVSVSHTPGRTPMKKRSARIRVRYLHNTQQTHDTKIHTFSRIRTRDSSNQAAPGLRLRRYGNRDRQAGLSIPLFFWTG